MKSIKDDKVQYAERTDRICHTGSAVQADCKECKGSIATGCQLYSHCEADFVFSEDKRQTVRNETILRCPEDETFSSFLSAIIFISELIFKKHTRNECMRNTVLIKYG